MSVKTRRARYGLLAALCATALALLWKPPIDPHRFDRGQNGLWLGHRWWAGHFTKTQVAALKRHILACGIRDLYFHVGPLDAAGHIPAADDAAWDGLSARLRQDLPGRHLDAWLGGVTVESLGKASDTVNLADADTRRGIVATAAMLVDKRHFDGIHYDLEVVPSGSLGLLALLNESRDDLPGHRISVATPMLRSGPIPYTDRGWMPDYLHRVADRCDQVDVMGYDSGAPTPEAYQRALRWEVTAACKALAGTRCGLQWGVPTYRDRTPLHHPEAETPEVALRGVAEGLRDCGDATPWQGVAVYAEWTTRDEDWAVMQHLWAGRP